MYLLSIPSRKHSLAECLRFFVPSFIPGGKIPHPELRAGRLLVCHFYDSRIHLDRFLSRRIETTGLRYDQAHIILHTVASGDLMGRRRSTSRNMVMIEATLEHPSCGEAVYETTGLYSRTMKRGINWIFAISLAGFHLGALAALFYFRWSALVVFVTLWVMAQNVGIAMGYHRLLTHRGYTTPKWLEYCIATCGTLALQGGPIYWVAIHRMHHKYTDKPGDPHSPRDGKWWSHMGWIMYGSVRNETEALKKYAPDLTRERFYLWLNKYHWLPLTVVGLLLFAFGGWPWILWGAFLPVTIGLHVTWMVNSVTHLWGRRRFSTSDDSRNNLWVALLTGGEGWHNNHHAFPVSARHGLAWYEVDFNYYGIFLLKCLGLARHVKTADLKRG
jgi:fatty-acid desaturase